MVKIILKTLLLTFLVFGLSFTIFYLKPEYKYNYLASLKLKLKKLNSIETNKIVFIGGSNLCFGINSEMIENEIEIPTVNMGLHASLGPKFWFEYVMDDLNEGDIVVISPEYGILKRDSWYGMRGDEVPQAILFTPSKLHILLSDAKLFKKTVTGIFRAIKYHWKRVPFDKKKHNIKYVYDLRSFDEDNIRGVYLNGNLKKNFGRIKMQFNEDSAPWRELKSYKEELEQKGVKIFLSPASILDESIDKDKAVAYLNRLSEKSEISILNNDLEFFYERALFHDTNYHLNAKGIQIRSEQLVNDLKAELNIENKSKQNRVFLSQNEFEPIPLSKMIMTHNIKVERDANKAVKITPQENKLGFIKYKTDFRDYIGSLLKLKVKCSPKVLQKLKFRGGKTYDFDYVKQLSEDTYILCKNLSNVIIHPRDYSSTSIGLGYDANTLTPQDSFTLLSAHIVPGDLTCSEVSEYKPQPEYDVPNDVERIILKVKSFDDTPIYLSEIINVNSNFVISNNTKYLLERKGDEVSMYKFYEDQLVLKIKLNSRLKFLNNSNFETELVY